MALLCSPAAAQTVPILPLACEGHAPQWFLNIDGPTARLTIETEITMDIPQSSAAQGREWPKALTLVGPRGQQTAIAVIDEAQCTTNGTDVFGLRVHLLTQRGQSPIVLTGCCAFAG